MPIVSQVTETLRARKGLLCIIVGARQVGKTTASLQIASRWQGLVIRASAGDPLPPGPERIRLGSSALLRHLFFLASSLPAQVVSYNRMLGQLVDAGNATTLAHYLHLLGSAFLLSGLEKFRGGGCAESRGDAMWWGRLTENAVGAALLNALQGMAVEVMYWREGNLEVDCVVRSPRRITAIEVKSSRSRPPRGLAAFSSRWPQAKPLVIGPGGMPLEEFFTVDLARLLA